MLMRSFALRCVGSRRVGTCVRWVRACALVFGLGFRGYGLRVEWSGVVLYLKGYISPFFLSSRKRGSFSVSGWSDLEWWDVVLMVGGGRGV